MVNNYSVFIDGLEVNEFYMSKKEAINLADDYINNGYDLVQIFEMDINNETV